MKAKSISGNSPASIQSSLQVAMQDGYHPTLAIIFISVKQDRNAIVQIFRDKDIDIIGATSSGEFTNGHQTQGETALLLLDIPKNEYRILFEATNGKDVATVARQATVTALSAFKNPAFILCSTCVSKKGEMFDGITLVNSIAEEAGNKTAIFGAMAGDDYQLTATYVFTNNESTDEGFVTLVLDNDKIELYGIALSGWKPLGKIRTVTKSEGGWLYAIDEQPALDMYLRYLGQSLEQVDGAKKNFVEEISMYYPFLTLDDGDPILRTPMGIDKEKNAIKLDFPVSVGKQIQFTLPPDFDIVETVLDSAASIKKEHNADADALLIFSCLGRLSALGPMVQDENEGLHKIWNAPMAGFFSYGEYGKGINDNNKIHSTTCSWVALKEK